MIRRPHGPGWTYTLQEPTSPTHGQCAHTPCACLVVTIYNPDGIGIRVRIADDLADAHATIAATIPAPIPTAQ